ncbi:amino acid adenylation domain-containing protein [Streptomyces sp. NPDC088557]|uniref:amino acid adenylation domain-containing protein n=1 Tax=Streptomyces sp. NPDC088557 TaxID=3365867 RepID=UPI00382C2D3C
MIAEQCARTPDNVAVVYPGGSLDYAELEFRSNGLARRIRELAPDRNSPVALCLERGRESVVAMLAVLKAGSAYVPLDPSHPPARLTHLLDDCGASVLVTTRETGRRLPEAAGLPRIHVGEEPLPGAAEPPRVTAHPQDAAYVLYTSGSTGRPKGVCMPHAPLVNLLRWQRSQLSAAPVTVHSTPLTFDVSFQEVFSTLCAGGRLVVAPEEARHDPGLLLDLVERSRATRLFLPFTALRRLAATADGRPAPRSLRDVITAGEQLQVTDEIRAWFSALPGCRLHNHYGPTETHVVTAHQLTGDPGGWPVLPPIGRPIEGVTAVVCDDRLDPVPDGVPGELLIGGAAPARGYARRPEATAERFLPDPRGTSGARLYRTGDLVRRQPDGTLHFLGRIDDQVKIRGFRVEPGEVEGVLAEHPDVAQAVVVAREDPATGTRLLAYYTTAADTSPDGAALRRHLRDRLPEYMVPTVFTALDALPQTPSGKTDRRALPDAPREHAETPSAPVTLTATERTLCELWSALLGTDHVPADADFFDLGGHSLLATQVMAFVRETFAVQLPLSAFFETRTVAGLAAAVGRARSGPAGRPLPTLEPAPEGGAPVLSFAQQRMWFLDRLAPGNPFYNITTAYRLRGEFSPDALRGALAALTARHEVLRTRFPAADGAPRQIVEPPGPVPVEVHDMGGVPAERREEEVRRLAEAAAALPFDLGRGPLLRVGVARLGPVDHVLWVVMHHIVCDGWSLEIFFRELTELYRAGPGAASALPVLPVQYSDYAAWQREALDAETAAGDLAHWEAALDGVPDGVALVTDRPRPTVSAHRGATHSLRLDPGLAEGLKELSRAAGTTLFMTLLGAFQVLLGRWTGTEDVVVGTPVSNRTHTRLEGLVGFFDNTLVMRTDLSGDPSFRQVLDRVRRGTLGALAHQDLPFERLVEELQPRRTAGRNPLFQVLFALQNAPEPHLDLAGAERFPVETGRHMVGFDLVCSCTPAGPELEVNFEYDAELFDAATVERLAAGYLAVLRSVSTSPDQCVSRVPLLDEAGARRVLALGTGAPMELPPVPLAHRLVEEQVRRTPDAVAAEDDGGSLTYAELDDLAAGLARRLSAAGAGPESVVALCLAPSTRLVVAMLGVWKAGAAFAPLDPGHPVERLRALVEGAGAGVLLTESALLPGLTDIAEHRAVICLDREDVPVGASPPPASPAAAQPTGLACVFHTSGSTGAAKGVMFVHRDLVSYALAIAGEFGLGPGDRFAQLASPGFDVLIEEVLPVLATGGTVVLPGSRILADGTDLTDWLAKHEISCVELTTAYWHEWTAGLIGSGRAPHPGLRLVVTGGERMLPERWDQWHRHFETPLLHIYGLTEATVTSTVLPYTPAAPGRPDPATGPASARQEIPVGRPIANTRLHVLDRAMLPVPVGVPGELYIGGTGPARGYLGRPAATAERFLPDPFAPRPGGVLYRTGDLARLRADGCLEFLGRADQAVKIRGHRVEPGEIESVLARHPAVGEALVLLQEVTPGDKRLVGYVAAPGPVPRREALTAELHGLLHRGLPAYLRPAALVVLDALPLNSHGKVDTRALPRPRRADLAAEDTYTPPSGPAETWLAGLVAELLGLDRVGAHDDFFALGAHSLLAVRLHARIREADPAARPGPAVHDIFEAPTVAALARRLAAAPEQHHAPSSPDEEGRS